MERCIQLLVWPRRAGVVPDSMLAGFIVGGHRSWGCCWRKQIHLKRYMPTAGGEEEASNIKVKVKRWTFSKGVANVYPTNLGLSTIGRSANYAVATFVLTSGVMYYWCDQKRREESRGMAIAVAGMKLLHEKKAREKAEAAAALEASRKAEEEARRRSWYKFW